MDPVILAVAPNGARKTTRDHSALPVTPEMLAETARTCRAAGAAMIHLHVRDVAQKHSLDIGYYREAMAAITDAVGDELLIQVTSEAVGIYQPKEQMEMVEALRPEAVSLALREFAPTEADEASACAFFRSVVEEGIFPQYILYNAEEVRRFARLRKAGGIPGEQVSVLFVMGKKTGVPEQAGAKAAWATPEMLDPFLEQFDGTLKLAETHWMVCAFGGNEQECAAHAIVCGGHARIGFENNHLMPDGSIAPDNAALVAGVRDRVERSKLRAVADANIARELFSGTIRIKS